MLVCRGSSASCVELSPAALQCSCGSGEEPQKKKAPPPLRPVPAQPTPRPRPTPSATPRAQKPHGITHILLSFIPRVF
ncbi:hypothetical protein cypCar_00040583 [Cyprinus carpio]|nr:hypothetical protein cypCar_00040583 [Cyprinus carpio]